MNKPNLLPVIETFKTVEYMGEHLGKLDMNEFSVSSDGSVHQYHKCGTVHCVGGWYAVAKLAADPEHPLHGERYIGFDIGVDMINEDAGLDLKSWAKNNPELWGNDSGGYIWCNPSAWDNAENLTGVIHHLERVQSRIFYQ